MSIGSISPVTAVLLANTQEFTARMDDAQAKMTALGASSDTAGQKFTKFGSMAADAVLGLGVAAAGFAVDEGFKLTETMDKLQNATGDFGQDWRFYRRFGDLTSQHRAGGHQGCQGAPTHGSCSQGSTCDQHERRLGDPVPYRRRSPAPEGDQGPREYDRPSGGGFAQCRGGDGGPGGHAPREGRCGLL